MLQVLFNFAVLADILVTAPRTTTHAAVPTIAPGASCDSSGVKVLPQLLYQFLQLSVLLNERGDLLVRMLGV